MTRNLKSLGLALVAVFAMSALAASAAPAATDHFRTHNGEPVELTAEALETQIFTVDGGDGEVKCSEIEFRDATVEDGDTTVTGEPVYNNTENTCEAAPLGKATIHTNSCHYTFTGETDVNGHAEVHIAGCSGPGIQITAALGCTITVPEQTVNGVSYENSGTTPEEDITLVPTVTGIDYSITSACIFAGISDKDDGTYEGKVTVTGWEDNDPDPGHGDKQVGISVEETED